MDFKSFDVSIDTLLNLDWDNLYPSGTNLNIIICFPFTMDEIREMVFSLKYDKSLESNDHSLCIASSTFQILLVVIFTSFSHNFDITMLLYILRINYVSFTLIPKEVTKSPSDFTPISLIV